MVTVYLALGTNVGEREENLRVALRHLAEAGVEVQTLSSIYETEPRDFLEQAWFLNAVCQATTELSAPRLLETLHEIESRMGSKKPFAKGPRLMDLDLLLYGDATIRTLTLEVPHPRMLERNFVLVPLAEIAPALRHASWPGPVSELLSHSTDRAVVRLVLKQL